MIGHYFVNQKGSGIYHIECDEVSEEEYQAYKVLGEQLIFLQEMHCDR